MLSRRRFAACVLCATSGLLATGSVVRAQGFTRTVVKRIDYPGSAHATIQVLVEVEPGAFIARHTHPGVESATIIEGGGTLQIDGEADRVLGAGDGFQVAPGVPHALRNGTAKTRVAAVYVVEKDKPLASPAG